MKKHKNTTWHKTLLFFIFLLLLSDTALAQTITIQNIRDAILGKEQFTQEQLKEMDLNNDGKLDVADLVKLVKSVNPSASVAEFKQSTSQIEEGSGTATITVNFSETFNGELSYTISGTASKGTDYTLTNSISVNGDSVDIPVTIYDDAEMEKDSETIVLAIDESSGCVPGALIEHILYIHDNDAIWDGTIENNNTALHFQMKIIQSPSGTTGAIVTDGFGIIPLNGDLDEWTAGSISLSNTLFDATVDNITIPGDLTLTNTDMTRKFVFHADSSQTDHLIKPDSEIKGNLTEYITCTSKPYLNREIKGTFTLLKQIPYAFV